MKHLVDFNHLGFTLLEMILAIAILSTVSSVGYLGLVQFNKSKDLNIATADFVNTLNEAKTDTQTQVNSLTCKDAGNSFIGYQVIQSGSSYSLQLICSNDSPTPMLAPAVCSGKYCITTLKTKQIPSSISLNLKKVSVNYNASDICHSTVYSDADTIRFNAPGGSLDSSYAANLNNAKGVGVDANGTILQCDASCNVTKPCPATP